ncbi:MAG: NADH-quinone oxidoreductase subunit N [Candidatus Micrarchaeales archaeon]|jgi:NADH-quinone oxidoreductase subunit N
MLGLFFAALVVLLVMGNMFLRMHSKRKKLTLAFNAVILLNLIASSYFLSNANYTYLNFFAANSFSAFFIFLFTIGIFLLHFLTYSHSQDYRDFALLSSFALVGMYIVASEVSLISIFLGLELVSMPSAFMILLSKRDGLEAAVKFFVMSSIAISLLSFAIVIVYGSVNTLILGAQQQSSLLLFALILFIASLGFEASIFPFNVLIPDIYQGSGAHMTAMLGGVNETVGFAALIQVLILLFINFNFAFFVVAGLAIFTMSYGNVIALVQDNLKRMLAYSSISQAGYILIGIAMRSEEGISASLFMIFSHAFLFIGAMSIVAWLESKDRNDLNGLIGLYKENRFCAVALSFFLLAFIGMPMTTGFVGKFLLFLSAVDAGVVSIVVIGILNTAISVFYYVKVISAVYTNKAGAYRIRVDTPTLFVIAFCLIITLAFGIYPQPLMQATGSAATYLLKFGI